MRFRLSGHNLTVSQGLQHSPQLAAVFVKYRLGCVGCSMAKFCTLNDAIRLYDLEQTDFQEDVERSLQAPIFTLSGLN